MPVLHGEALVPVWCLKPDGDDEAAPPEAAVPPPGRAQWGGGGHATGWQGPNARGDMSPGSGAAHLSRPW